MTGFVYCIGERAGSLVKVGYSADPLSRLNKLRADNPREIRLLGVIAGDTALEAQLHERFAALHVRGEWFEDREGQISRCFGPLPVEQIEVTDLRSWLKANGITQAELADHIGVRHAHLSLMMSGGSKVSAQTAWLIECATGGAIPMQFWASGYDCVAPLSKSTGAA
jgi:predicted XRE-type DNA-binding protein